MKEGAADSAGMRDEGKRDKEQGNKSRGTEGLGRGARINHKRGGLGEKGTREDGTG